jgi:hypothetical protein
MAKFVGEVIIEDQISEKGLVDSYVKNNYYELRNNRRAHFLDTSWIVSRFELDTRIRPNLKCDLVRVLTN